MKRRQISMALVIIMLISIIQININPVNAASLKMKWNKNDTLDSMLKLVNDKAGQDDVLLELQMEAAGNYALEYYLENGKRTTVNFVQKLDRLVVGYKVEEIDGIAPDPANITQSEIDASFSEMNYGLSIPDWQFIEDRTVNAAGELSYTIMKSAGSQFPGIAFNINGNKVILKWDFQTNKVYYLMTGYNEGTLMPVYFTSPGNPIDTIMILKSLEDFIVTPTHLVKDTTGLNNMEVAPILNPGTEKAGNRPGLQITFKQPKALNPVTWQYEGAVDLSELNCLIDLQDIGTDVQTDINFNLNTLNGLQDRTINELPAGNTGGVNYSYVNGTYTINLVKDKTSLANQDEIIQWSALESSKIYNVTIDFQGSTAFSDYQFDSYVPESKFAYTYMEYELRRANMNEAYLDIKPYDVGAQDEIEYKILHRKVLPLDPEDDLWVRHYYSSQSSTGNIYIPVPFSKDSSIDYYQVIVNFSGVDLNSQILAYRAKDDLNIPTTTPRIDDVDRLYVIPDDFAGIPDPLKAQFDLVWTAPDNDSGGELETIFADDDDESNRIYYELLVNDVPTDTEDNPFQVIKVFEVKKDAIDGLYKLAVYAGLDGIDSSMQPAAPTTSIDYNEGYNSLEDLFRMEQISLYEQGEWTHIIETQASEDTNTYTVNYTDEPYDFEYPGVNYIRIRAITKIDTEVDGITETKIGISYPSIPYSLSLSPVEYNIPIPDALAYRPLVTNDVNNIGITLDWHTVDIQPYEDAMLEPVNREVGNLYYGVYISEDVNAIRALEVPDEPYLGDPLYTPIQDNPRVITEPNVELSPAEVLLLRDQEVLFYDVETDKDLDTLLSAEITGLDKNTNYYVRIVTKVRWVDIAHGHSRTLMSDPSDMLSITTPQVPEPPNDDEVKPLSVEDLQVDFADDAQLSAKISWSFPDETLFGKDQYGFEIISIEDKALPDALKLNTLKLEDLIDETSLAADHLEYWRVYVATHNGEDVPLLVKYNQATAEWEVQPHELLTVGDNTISFVDPSNAPNKVYYYYVRTINIKGIVKSASPWVMDTLTTIPVKGPINLMASYDSGYTYNAKSQSIIRFDAPIPDDAVVGTDYMMEIFVKGQADADYTMTKYPVTFLKEGTDPPTGYRRLYYRISGLKAGNAYNVKVRIEDRTIDMELLPDGTMAYPKSAYSERIIVRTEFDQGEYDKEVKFKAFLDYFDLKVKDLEAGSYIVLEKTTSKHVVKYRDNYAVGDLQLNANGTYTLLTEAVKTNVIYLPAQFMETVNAKNITLTLKPNGQSMAFRPYTLGKGITSVINDKIAEIKKVNAPLVDYYIKITAECSPYTGTILSKTPSSMMVDLKIEIIGSEELEEDIDDMMVDELTGIIASRRLVLIEDLTEQLESGLDENKMLDITKEAVESVKENYQFSGNLVFVDVLESTGDAVTALPKNIQIGIKPKASEFGLKVFKKTGTSWILQQSNYFAPYYFTETMAMTSYILLPQEANGLSLGNQYTNDELDVINKYNLYEIFNSTELSSSQLTLTKYRMLPAYASILGMSIGNSEAQFLKDKGITFSTANLYGNLTRQEVLYLYTQVFGVKNNIKLNNVNIYNYNIIQDITKVNEGYRNVLLIGANMNMFNLTNGMLLPDNSMTIKEFIALLSKIEKGFN